MFHHSDAYVKKSTISTYIAQPLALWGGIECTVHRVGDQYFDQLQRTGHHHRCDDIKRLADLGLQTIRYPLLWERAAPHRPDQIDWQWADERMQCLREHQIRPIVGLVHHGCGPRYATFERTAFERELPRYARQVAERFPWIDAYTPINEPLTTARFSGLYGHWYPHGRHDKVFAQLLVRECRTTIRVMREVRLVNPAAQLVQTDDLGQTHSSSRLSYQADFENERRWLTWDLLCGRVTPHHPMWGYLRYAGITEADLWYMVENACPPSIIGINHYLTSERYLDHKLATYPKHLWGGNGRHTYADTEVVQAAPEKRVGLEGLIRQTWQRYQMPIVITEAHLGSTVDEQLRYLWEFWQAAEQAKAAGADVQAVTVWAMLGSYDWHCLLTRCENYYEAGTFDVSSGRPQPTELAALVHHLATGKPARHLIPPGRGWWQTANADTPINELVA
ncbi:family 1 glycosylhydrolase [Nibrella viscosa]|uniref:Family 1 glycosylhydrolase n=1 Tax=Nibrella viscosa TaxID=1084524 RepID=A0ABP8K0L1_9BACT